MAHITFDETASKSRLPTWRVACERYPGQVTLEGTPYLGIFESWLKGVAQPLDGFTPTSPPTWEEFATAKHYRTNKGVVSVIGFTIDLFDNLITDAEELRRIYEERCRATRVVEVTQGNRSVAWHLAVDDSPDAHVWFSRFWHPQEVVEDETSVKISFQPSLLAQLRHWFSLKPWSITIYAPQLA